MGMLIIFYSIHLYIHKIFERLPWFIWLIGLGLLRVGGYGLGPGPGHGSVVWTDCESRGMGLGQWWWIDESGHAMMPPLFR